MNKKLSKLLAAVFAACLLTTATPVATVTAGAATSTSQSASTEKTMYATKTDYTYNKKGSRMVKSTKVNKGDALKVKSEYGKYYLLTNGKYILKTSVSTKRTTWTETKLSKAATKYVVGSAKVVDKPISSGKKQKTLSNGTKITVVAKTNSGYFKLKDGGYIKQSAVTSTKPVSAADIKAVAPSAAAKKAGSGITLSKSEGKVFNIYCWNEEFKTYFESYYTVPKGVKVNWIINPNIDGVYQYKLDEALRNQKTAGADEKVDLFLVEPDYMDKYVDSEYTMDVSKIGVKPYTTEYAYTYQAATDDKGKLKGVSYCPSPSAIIYRRSIAEDVLGTSDPDKVQKMLSTWDKFNDVAKQAKDKGYYMTASYETTYRAFSQNKSYPWVDSKNKLVLDSHIKDWMNQTETFLKNGYTTYSGIWGDEAASHATENGKAMCFYGAAWYYNYTMSYYDFTGSTVGDWAICQGPEASYWGGTWLLAAAGSDNPEMIADVMNAFTANEKICSKLVENEGILVNNTTVNKKYMNKSSYNNEFLGGQCDFAVLDKIAKNIEYKNTTVYDMILNEKFTSFMIDFFSGYVDKNMALDNFYAYINETFPKVKTP